MDSSATPRASDAANAVRSPAFSPQKNTHKSKVLPNEEIFYNTISINLIFADSKGYKATVQKHTVPSNPYRIAKTFFDLDDNGRAAVMEQCNQIHTQIKSAEEKQMICDLCWKNTNDQDSRLALELIPLSSPSPRAQFSTVQLKFNRSESCILEASPGSPNRSRSPI